MQILKLYRHVENGSTVVSLEKPEGEYTTLYRVIADEGNILRNGEQIASVIDTSSPNDWVEEAVAEEPEEEIVYTPSEVEPLPDVDNTPMETVLSKEAALAALLIDHEYRITLIELGVQ
jgi:hypothetical protein